jgi:hypothetical protein
MTGIAAPAPDFESVVVALGKLTPFEQHWLKRNSELLQEVFNQQLMIAQSRELDLSPFEPDVAAQALRRVIKLQPRPRATVGRNPRTGSGIPVRAWSFRFSLPCCSKYPGTYPICNPEC